MWCIKNLQVYYESIFEDVKLIIQGQLPISLGNLERERERDGVNLYRKWGSSSYKLGHFKPSRWLEESVTISLFSTWTIRHKWTLSTIYAQQTKVNDFNFYGYIVLSSTKVLMVLNSCTTNLLLYSDQLLWKVCFICRLKPKSKQIWVNSLTIHIYRSSHHCKKPY